MIDTELFFGADFFSEDQEPKLSLKDGELREVAVLFADIKGFTNISNLFEPEVIHLKMDEILKIFSRSINFYGGFVDKYIGDGVMALFGAKKASEQDTQRAILAAIKMQEQLRLYNSLLSREPGFEELELGLRIGINTGLVSVGRVGESREGDFTVYGPQVNLASRMESNAPVNRIMMPRQTKVLVDSIFEFEHKGEVMVKGMDDPIDCWLVTGQKIEKKNVRSNKFIGREEELAVLADAFEESGVGLKLIGLKGDAGIGKSRLISEFTSSLSDILLLKGFCSPISPSPFNVFTNLLQIYFNINPNEKTALKKDALWEALSALAQECGEESVLDAFPLIGFLMEVRITDSRLEQKGKDLLDHLFRALETVIFAIIGLAVKKRQNVVIVMEDIHHVDDASAQLLGYLLHRVDQREHSVLFIFSYRLDYEILPCIALHPCFTFIELTAFSRELMDEMLKQYTAGMKLGDETLKLVRELSGGNPFYLEQWSSYIGSLPQTELDEYPVPGNIHALILSRLDALPHNLRLLLHKASVIGNEFFVDILTEIDKKLEDNEDLSQTLVDLEEHSLIMKLLGYDYSSYLFKNITTREVAYQTLLHQNRKMLHQLTAEAIEKLFGDRLDSFVYALADHYDKAGDEEKAELWLSKALKKATKLYDNPLAIRLAKRLLEFVHEPQRRAETLMVLAEALWIGGAWEDAVAVIDEAAELIDPQSPVYCELYRLKGMTAFYWGEIDQAREAFENGLNLARCLDDKYQICIALNSMGIWFQHNKQIDEALKLHEESLFLAREIKDMQRQAKTLSNLGLIYLETKEFAKAKELFLESLAIARKHQFLRDESIALGNLGWANYVTKDCDEAEMWLKQKLSLAEKMFDRPELIKAVGNLGNINYERGDYQTALKYYERSLALKEQIGNQKEIEVSRKAVETVRAKLAES
ncbi:MAG: tetratricopeptide repeat protein [Candidatus Cloacimonetes bacterium]|nr:tetratricopeptide repeat protein [Candidatus Cloacimonadota bacterium]NLO44764.1 tetratricopeptide repeat protein [Candidatus Cloacimonadota bacterium]